LIQTELGHIFPQHDTSLHDIIQSGKFLDRLSNYQLFKKQTVP